MSFSDGFVLPDKAIELVDFRDQDLGAGDAIVLRTIGHQHRAFDHSQQVEGQPVSSATFGPWTCWKT